MNFTNTLRKFTGVISNAPKMIDNFTSLIFYTWRQKCRIINYLICDLNFNLTHKYVQKINLHFFCCGKNNKLFKKINYTIFRRVKLLKRCVCLVFRILKNKCNSNLILVSQCRKVFPYQYIKHAFMLIFISVQKIHFVCYFKF